MRVPCSSAPNEAASESARSFAVDDLIEILSCPKDRCHTHARLSSSISRADSVGARSEPCGAVFLSLYL